MRWPWAGTSNSNSRDDKSPKLPTPPDVDLTDVRSYLTPQAVIPTTILTGAILVGRRLYVLYVRRIPGAARITNDFWRKRSLFGRVTSVGDGDGFRLFHTPGGRLMGWGWFPGRKVPSGKALKDNTVSVRLAGVDAPEAAHFGNPAQPGAKEARDWLTSYVGSRRVRAYVYKKDQYDRAVASVYVRRGLLRRDVGLQMLRKGLATVYEAKTGAEFGQLEQKYRRAEKWAKVRRIGIWGGRKKDFESPRDYKTRTVGES